VKRFLWYQFPLLAACSAIFAASAISQIPLPPVFQIEDKLFHAIAYGVLAILAYRAFLHQDLFTPLRVSPFFSSTLFATMYGVTDELHQYFVPGRRADVWDIVADALGSVVFVAIARRWIALPTAATETTLPSGNR
jgi:VanZ family protein